MDGQFVLVHFGDELLGGAGDLGTGEVREYGHWRNRYSPAAGGSSKFAQNFRVVIRIRVPIDLHAVASNGSAAFALATPLRLGQLVALAVRESIGSRAPHDKFQRNVQTALAGLAAGRFTIDVDGRTFADPEQVVVCREVASVRFYLPARKTQGLRSELTAPER